MHVSRVSDSPVKDYNVRGITTRMVWIARSMAAERNMGAKGEGVWWGDIMG